MDKHHGLLLAGVLAFFTILIAPLLQPQWLMGLVVIFYSLILFRFFDTRYLTYVFVVLAVLYAVGMLPLLFFSTTLAILVVGEIVFFRGANDDLNTYLYYIIVTAWAGTLVMVY